MSVTNVPETPWGDLTETPERNKYLDKVSLQNVVMHTEAQLYSEREIYKAIFFLSTGTFALSIAFIGYLKDFIDPWYLIFAWIFLAGAIAADMRLHWVASLIEKRKVQHLNTSRTNNFKPMWTDLIRRDEQLFKWSDSAYASRTLAVQCLGLGLLALLAFGIQNLLYQNQKNLHGQGNQPIKAQVIPVSNPQ